MSGKQEDLPPPPPPQKEAVKVEEVGAKRGRPKGTKAKCAICREEGHTKNKCPLNKAEDDSQPSGKAGKVRTVPLGRPAGDAKDARVMNVVLAIGAFLEETGFEDAARLLGASTAEDFADPAELAKKRKGRAKNGGLTGEEQIRSQAIEVQRQALFHNPLLFHVLQQQQQVQQQATLLQIHQHQQHELLVHQFRIAQQAKKNNKMEMNE
jgi:hypothetical protein